LTLCFYVRNGLLGAQGLLFQLNGNYNFAPCTYQLSFAIIALICAEVV